MLERSLKEDDRTPAQAKQLADAIIALRDTTRPAQARLQAGLAPKVRAELAHRPLRDHVSPSAEYPWQVERDLALYGAWY